MFNLIVDNRERAIFDEIEQIFSSVSQDVIIEYKQLNIGDFIIMEDNCIRACIERKTLADFIATIKDGRYDNKDKMIKLREQTSCRLIYLITDAKYADMPFNIQAAANHLILRDNIHVVYDSLQILREYIRVYTVMKLPLVAHEPINITEIRTPLEIEVINCWTTLPGISPTVAAELVKRFSIYEFLNLPQVNYDFKIANRNITQPVHNALEKFRNENINILSGINGISVATANVIGETILMRNMINISVFDNIRIGGKKIVKKAEHILEVLQYKNIIVTNIKPLEKINSNLVTSDVCTSDVYTSIEEQLDDMQLK